jgi:nitrogen fixation NifU-like protein
MAERHAVVQTGESVMSDKSNDTYGRIYDETDYIKRKPRKPEDYENWLKALYLGLMDNNVGCGASTTSNGETMRIFLKFEEERVIQATFSTNGSAAGSVCGFFAAQLALGKTRHELAEVTGKTIIEFMGGLPEQDRQAAFLAAESLRKAIQHYRVKRETTNRRSWQKPCLVAANSEREREREKN